MVKHPQNKAERLNAKQKKERARQRKEEREGRVRRKIVLEELKAQEAQGGRHSIHEVLKDPAAVG